MNGSFFRLLLPLIALLLAFGAAAMLTAQEAELRISESSTAKEPEGRLLLAAPLSEEENPQNLTTEVFIEFDPSTDSNA
ncbi:MAG: hypothetical protein FJ088_08695, partial [Deltaproteobacteria bacterium]|nr:hypothetical protein [Deltaproteobacteria bacterium]